MQMCHDNDESNNRKGREWIFDDIKKHQEVMLNILLGQ